MIVLALGRIGQRFFDELAQCLTTEDITSATAHITLSGEWFELATEEDGFFWRVWEEHITEVLHHDISVVVGFQEPIVLVQVLVVEVLERCLNMKS